MINIIYPSAIKLNKKYTIHSIFNKSFNIIADDKIININTELNYYANNSIFISKNITKKCIVGKMVIFDEDTLTIGVNKFNVIYQQLDLVFLTLDEKQYLLSEIDKFLSEFKPDIVKSAADEYIKVALNQINEKYFENEICNKYVGLGYGLTPCIDDYLAGIIFIQKVLNKNIKFKLPLGKTTQVSQQMLESFSSGTFYKCFLDLVELSNQKKDIKDTLKIIAKIGSSSGYYMLLGMQMALKKD